MDLALLNLTRKTKSIQKMKTILVVKLIFMRAKDGKFWRGKSFLPWKIIVLSNSSIQFKARLPSSLDEILTRSMSKTEKKE